MKQIQLLILLIKAECWVAGVGSLLLAIFAILALVNKMWLQLGMFAIIFAAGAVILLMSVHILFWIDILKELVEKPKTDKHIRTNENA